MLYSRRTHEEYQQIVEEKYGKDSYELLSKYKYSTEKIKIKHIECGQEFDIVANNFIRKERKIGCPFCSINHGKQKIAEYLKSKKITTEEYKQRVFEIVGEEYLVLGKYEGANIPIEMQHSACGHKWKVRPSGFLFNGIRCPICSNESRRIKISDALSKDWGQLLIDVQNKYQGEYQILEKSKTIYKNNRSIIEIYHKKCEKVYTGNPHNLLYGFGCPYCAIKKGEDCHFWKGGITPINAYLRGCTLEWQIKSKKEYSDRCIITNKSTDLVIHHAFKNFSEIRDEVISENNIDTNLFFKDFSEKELGALKAKILLKHYKYGYGVPLNRKLHDEFHSIYGTSNNTIQQLIDFAKTKGVILELTLDRKLKRTDRT